EMLRQLGSQVDAAIGSLQAQSEQTTTAQLEREQRMAAQADDTVAKLGSLIENLMVDVRTIIGEVRSTADAMGSVTSDVVSRMNSGAETMFLAADGFSKAGRLWCKWRSSINYIGVLSWLGVADGQAEGGSGAVRGSPLRSRSHHPVRSVVSSVQ